MISANGVEMSKRALITGITGQDGSYLAELLLEKGYEVYGLVRRSSNDPFVRIEHIKNRLRILSGSITDLGAVRSVMEQARPDEVYNLAAQSHVGDSFCCALETFDTNYYGALKVVDEALRVNRNVRIYQASTSEMFGNSPPPQNERTSFNPQSPYAEAKTATHEKIVLPCRNAGCFICSGFLFNHESPRRGKHFVTRKITYSLAKIVLGLQDHLELGNLDAKRDWGYAPDYVKAMWKMLQKEKPDDYVVATGKTHSVRDFVTIAARMLARELRWDGQGAYEVGYDQFGNIIVRVNQAFYRPQEVHYLEGDAQKACRILGWKPEKRFVEMIYEMVQNDIREVYHNKSTLVA